MRKFGKSGLLHFTGWPPASRWGWSVPGVVAGRVRGEGQLLEVLEDGADRDALAEQLAGLAGEPGEELGQAREVVDRGRRPDVGSGLSALVVGRQDRQRGEADADPAVD